MMARVLVHRQNPTCLLTLCFALMWMMLAGAPALAQTAPSPPPASQPVKPPPKPPLPPHVPAAEVATQAETVAINIRSIEAGLASDPIVPYVASNLPSLSDENDARLDETSKILQSNPSLETLRTQDEDWQTLDKQLQDWKKQLLRRQAWVHERYLYLTGQQKLWEDTKLTVQAQRMSAEMEDVVYETTAALIDAVKDIHERYLQINDLLQQTDQQDARARDVLASLDDAHQQAFNRLLERDAPAIWSPAERTMTPSATATQSQNSFKTQLSAVRAYIGRNSGRFLPHLLLLILLAGVLLWLRRRVKANVTGDPQLVAAAPVFCSPLSTALVIWFMVGLWIYPHAPRLFWAIAGAMALIPTVVLLRGLVSRRMLPLLTALVIFYFVDQVRSVLETQPVLSRWVFLGEMAAALFVVILLLRSNGAAETPGTTMWIGRIVRGATWMAALMLAATVLADVIGFVSLARLIGDATLRSAYLGLILYAALRIADALLVLAFHGRPLSLLRVVREHRDLMLFRAQQVLEWGALALWGLFVLQLFWIRDQVFAYARDVLDRPLGFGIHQTPYGVIRFGLVVWASFMVSRFIRFILEEDVYDRLALPTGIPYAISKLLHYVILIVGFFMALAALGIPLTNFTILAGAFSVGIGFGLQNIVNNFVSGLILLFERPVKVGDVVQLDDAAGVVGQIGIRASVIRTPGGAEVIVPNAMFISSRVTNWTLSNSQRGIEVDVNVAAGPRPQDVIELLQRVASSHPLVSDSPRPVAMLAKFTVDTYSYELHAWTERVESWMSIRSDLTVAVSDALAKANMPVK